MGRNLNDFSGIIPPAAGGEEQIQASEAKRAAARRAKGPQTGISYKKNTGEGGIVAEETIDESQIPTAAPKGRKPITASGPRGAVPEGGQRARTRDVVTPLVQLHGMYKTLINTARSMKLSESHQDALDIASGHLMNSAVSGHRAHSEGNLGKWNMDRDVTHGHLQDAVEHLSAAHNTLVASGIHATLASRNMTSALPSDDTVADLVAKSQTLQRTGVGGVSGALKPYKRGVIGRAGEIAYNKGSYTLKDATKDPNPAEFGDKDVNEISRMFGRDHPGVQKLIAMRGTPRGQKSRVSKEDRREGVAEVTGAGVASGNIANPKRRGSGRRIDVDYRTDANPSNNTGGKPKF